MSQSVTLELSEEALRRYQRAADAANKPLAFFIAEWLREHAPALPEDHTQHGFDLLKERFKYIDDLNLRATALELVREVVAWNPDRISLRILKTRYRAVFDGKKQYAYLWPLRGGFCVHTARRDGWADGFITYKIETIHELDNIREILRAFYAYPNGQSN